jgi:hypothetical protein
MPSSVCQSFGLSASPFPGVARATRAALPQQSTQATTRPDNRLRHDHGHQPQRQLHLVSSEIQRVLQFSPLLNGAVD